MTGREKERVENREGGGGGGGGGSVVSGQWIVGWWWIFKGEQLQSGRTPSALERKLATSIIKFWGSPQMPITVIRSFFCNANCLIPYPTTPTPMATAKALWLLPWLSCGVSERGASELHESGILLLFFAVAVVRSWHVVPSVHTLFLILTGKHFLALFVINTSF